jgi:hypothetical protein
VEKINRWFNDVYNAIIAADKAAKAVEEKVAEKEKKGEAYKVETEKGSATKAVAGKPTEEITPKAGTTDEKKKEPVATATPEPEKKDNKEEKKEKEDKPQLKIITKKIMPKLLTIRIKSPDDFDNIKKLVEHDLLIITIDVPPEAILKEFLDFKGYLETMNYNLGKVEENVILAYKAGINIDRYPLKTAEEK